MVTSFAGSKFKANGRAALPRFLPKNTGPKKRLFCKLKQLFEGLQNRYFVNPPHPPTKKKFINTKHKMAEKNKNLLPKLPKTEKAINQAGNTYYIGSLSSYLKLPKLPKVGNIQFLGKISVLIQLFNYQRFINFR
jgi:hypothetical protein